LGTAMEFMDMSDSAVAVLGPIDDGVAAAPVRQVGRSTATSTADGRHRRVGEVLKRVIDVVGATVLLLACLPTVVLVALAIKLDSSGPVFFAQLRPGLDGQFFRLYKFRTMYASRGDGARPHRPEQIREMQEYGKLRRDPRVTRVGRLLRRWSIDELPQLWNVIRGDMSLVGPRPYLRWQMGALGERRAAILQSRPGLTGLWQVSGRNNLRFRTRMAMDLWYTRHRRMSVDLAILARTLIAVVTARGAY
jgi:lipopolysaccharide/colanic/teichoic acid biosynthesis glycosyltransferase